MSTLYVKVKGHFLVDGQTLVDPGSVVPLEKEMAEQFVKRGLGKPDSGPAHYVQGGRAEGAPRPRPEAEAEAEASPDPESLDLGERLAKAERATGRPQARRAGAI